MVDIQHPAWVLQRGKPSRATVGSETYDLDDEGVFTVEDEAAATQAMDRLADTYGVEYNDDGTIEGESTPTAVETDGDSTTPIQDAVDAETDSGSESEAYERAELEGMEHEELKDVADEVGVDSDSVDMRSSDNVVAAILQEQSDGVETSEGDE